MRWFTEEVKCVLAIATGFALVALALAVTVPGASAPSSPLKMHALSTR